MSAEQKDLAAGFAALAAAERAGQERTGPLPAPLLARILADAAAHQPQAARAPWIPQPRRFGLWAKGWAGLSAALGPSGGGLVTAGLAGLLGLGLGLWGSVAEGPLEGLTMLWNGGVETVELWPEGATILEEG